MFRLLCRLQCRYSAEPAPHVTWRFNGVELSANQRLSLTADDSQSTLVINGASLADTGEYVCTATNVLGEAATKTFLRVRSELLIRYVGLCTGQVIV